MLVSVLVGELIDCIGFLVGCVEWLGSCVGLVYWLGVLVGCVC